MKRQNNPPASQESSPPAGAIIQQGELFAGPLPHPALMKQYGEIDKDFPERILRMAEKHADAFIRNENRESRTFSISQILGQILTFILGLAGIASGIFLALKGFSSGAIAAIIGGFAPIVISALKNLKK